MVGKESSLRVAVCAFILRSTPWIIIFLHKNFKEKLHVFFTGFWKSLESVCVKSMESIDYKQLYKKGAIIILVDVFHFKMQPQNIVLFFFSEKKAFFVKNSDPGLI